MWTLQTWLIKSNCRAFASEVFDMPGLDVHTCATYRKVLTSVLELQTKLLCGLIKICLHVRPVRSCTAVPGWSDITPTSPVCLASPPVTNVCTWMPGMSNICQHFIVNVQAQSPSLVVGLVSNLCHLQWNQKELLLFFALHNIKWIASKKRIYHQFIPTRCL